MGISGNSDTSAGLSAVGMKFTLVASRYNSDIVDRLLHGAVTTLEQHGAGTDSIELVRVPGAFELPLACQRIASLQRSDAIIAIGAVVRGDTPHFDYVAGNCARGLADVALKFDLPVVFGVLTVDTQEQALARAGDNAQNKGVEAALTAIEMVSVLAGFAR